MAWFTKQWPQGNTCRVLSLERPSIANRIRFRGGRCQFGAFSYGNRGVQVYSADIGRFCSIGQDVLIGPVEHPTNWLSSHSFVFNDRGKFGEDAEFSRIVASGKLKRRNRTQIGHDIWFGARSFVRRGVSIGNGAIVAAHSVVLEDVHPYTIVAGVPAKKVKNRFPDEVIDRLQALEWWNYLLDWRALGEPDYAEMEKVLSLLEEKKQAGLLDPLKPEVLHIERGSVANALGARWRVLRPSRFGRQLSGAA